MSRGTPQKEGRERISVKTVGEHLQQAARCVVEDLQAIALQPAAGPV